ncbi:hypothetical protein GGQ86_000375 [Xanthobacter flavus]|uniref:Uncharacterized protein n=1 Tax=Xanthobacter flavus TaxID=281 RepID=A0A9W6FQ21_XANFL|nr:hypothetical protein [Xanthobacter flavus]MDR6331928.1 hypothetical protein [Xanthobacter flavus]GLI25638.1 hypothetical protein XFLAVUS301_53120 [Xanthobacter flavus]
MSGLLGPSDDQKKQQARDAASSRGSALAALLAREAELDTEGAAGSSRRARGKRLLRSLTDEDGNATLG